MNEHTHVMLNRRTIGIRGSEFFQGKIKKTGFFWFLGNHSWLVSNNPSNKKFRRGKDRPEPIDTYLYIDVLANLDRFFDKSECREHLANLISIIANNQDGQSDNDFDDYLLKNTKHILPTNN